MDDEIDNWFADIENPAPDVRPELPPPYCDWCHGLRIEESQWIPDGRTAEILEYQILQTQITWTNVLQIRRAHLLVHKKHGFVIEMHQCDEISDWALRLAGPLPQTKEKRKDLDAFMKYAWSVKRGRKPKVEEIKQNEAVLFESRLIAAMVAILDIPEKITQKIVARKLWPTKRKNGDRLLRKLLQQYDLEWDDIRQKAAQKFAE